MHDLCSCSLSLISHTFWHSKGSGFERHLCSYARFTYILPLEAVFHTWHHSTFNEIKRVQHHNMNLGPLFNHISYSTQNLTVRPVYSFLQKGHHLLSQTGLRTFLQSQIFLYNFNFCKRKQALIISSTQGDIKITSCTLLENRATLG